MTRLPLISSAVAAVALAFGLSLGAASAASATQPMPDCMNDPWGGCATGPYNGQGGGGVGTIDPVLNNYSTPTAQTNLGFTIFTFTALNGSVGTYDPVGIRVAYGFGSCVKATTSTVKCA
jgi:opacity protein-like surface antigen